MAATINSNTATSMVPFLKNAISLSGLTAGATETISHSGPRGCRADEVSFEVTTPPTSGDPVLMSHLASSDSTTNNTVALKFDTVPAGSLSGAVVKVTLTFYAQASGGLAAPF